MPKRTAFLEHQAVGPVGQDDLGRCRRKEQLLTHVGRRMAIGSLPDQAECDQVGDEKDERSAGEPHKDVNFCDARRKPQARVRGQEAER